MKKERFALYEGMYILSATLSEDSRKKAFDKILAGITEKRGTVEKVFERGRQKLAYEIDGKREGFYYVVFFNAPTSIIQETWKEYHLHEDLIRFQTVRVEKVQETLDFPPLKIAQ
jgi:small subunit ribosomal protein S6